MQSGKTSQNSGLALDRCRPTKFEDRLLPHAREYWRIRREKFSVLTNDGHYLYVIFVMLVKTPSPISHSPCIYLFSFHCLMLFSFFFWYNSLSYSIGYTWIHCVFEDGLTFIKLLSQSPQCSGTTCVQDHTWKNWGVIDAFCLVANTIKDKIIF